MARNVFPSGGLVGSIPQIPMAGECRALDLLSSARRVLHAQCTASDSTASHEQSHPPPLHPSWQTTATMTAQEIRRIPRIEQQQCFATFDAQDLIFVARLGPMWSGPDAFGDGGGGGGRGGSFANMPASMRPSHPTSPGPSPTSNTPTGTSMTDRTLSCPHFVSGRRGRCRLQCSLALYEASAPPASSQDPANPRPRPQKWTREKEEKLDDFVQVRTGDLQCVRLT